MNAESPTPENPTTQEPVQKETSVGQQDGILIQNVGVIAGDKRLLQNVEAEFRSGEITLVVGPSGVGKSILMKIMAGLIPQYSEGIRWSGNVLIGGEKATAGLTGVVFQSFALFDEMTPKANVEFAHACGKHHASETSTTDLLEGLRVPFNVPTSRLSGGQRQRLAIARTLAYNPTAILYDEPTSGLDPETGKQVAELIRQTHQQYGKTSVIVTHDYHSLMPIADRIFLLDPVEMTLVDVPQDQWAEIPQQLAPMASASIEKDEQVEELSLAGRVLESLVEFCESTTRGIVTLFVGLISLIPFWKSPVWGARFLGHYFRMVFGPTAIIYLIAAGLISGFVTTYFTFQFLPYSNYTQPLLIEDLLTALGFAMYRIFVPVLACVLIAARCGAAVTSDLGGRQFGNQIDALKTIGAAPRYYLLSPILWAFLIGTPFLTFCSFFAAKYTSLVTFSLAHPDLNPDFWNEHFHRSLIRPNELTYRGFAWLISKLLTCGVGIAIIAYCQGVKPKFSTTDVSRSVTSTILWATLFSLFVHYLFALYEYENAVPK